MDSALLHTLRNKINENGLVLHIYRDRDGKNQWSIICSAMDWIEVSLDGINLSALSRQNDNQASIQMILFISCVDIMWESIQQLHRVFFDSKDIPFKTDCSIFKQNVSDNVFFKKIRACFAAHPVNLKDLFSDDLDNERWFASWSGGTFSNKDFSVILYSNNPSKESRFFDVDFMDIYAFAEKRYTYIQDLVRQIDQAINLHNEKYRSIPIAKDIDIRKNIDILLDANKKRFNNDYFEYELMKIKRAFTVREYSSKKNLYAFEKYKTALIIELDEIRGKLQNMDLTDLKTEVTDSAPSNIQYPFSILSDSVWQGKPCVLFEYVVHELQSHFKNLLDINISMTPEEVYVIACAGFYNMV